MGGLDPAGWVLLVIAPFIGSFLGVLIKRLPRGEPIAWSRSHCPHCAAVLGPRDLVPLVSWLAARGRCRYCGAALGWFYPAVELACLAIAAISLVVDTGWPAWLDWLLGCWLLTLAWIDAEHFLLPDALTLPLVAAGLAATAVVEPALWLDRVAGMVCGYAGFRLLMWAYRRLRGREGLGGGDAKLLAAGGAWVGVGGVPSAVFIAAVAGLAAAAIIVVAGGQVRRDTALPFGPFLALAIWLVWLFGPLPFWTV